MAFLTSCLQVPVVAISSREYTNIRAKKPSSIFGSLKETGVPALKRYIRESPTSNNTNHALVCVRQLSVRFPSFDTVTSPSRTDFGSLTSSSLQIILSGTSSQLRAEDEDRYLKSLLENISSLRSSLHGLVDKLGVETEVGLPRSIQSHSRRRRLSSKCSLAHVPVSFERPCGFVFPFRPHFLTFNGAAKIQRLPSVLLLVTGDPLIVEVKQVYKTGPQR